MAAGLQSALARDWKKASVGKGEVGQKAAEATGRETKNAILGIQEDLGQMGTRVKGMEDKFKSVFEGMLALFAEFESFGPMPRRSSRDKRSVLKPFWETVASGSSLTKPESWDVFCRVDDFVIRGILSNPTYAVARKEIQGPR